MITSIFISHYKSITEQSAKLRNVNVLVGKNGSGKSNIVDALSFIADIAQDDLDFAITKRHGSDSVRQWSKFKPFNTTISVDVENREGSGSYKIVFSSSRNSYKVIEEVFSWKGEATYSDDVFDTTITRSSNFISDIITDYDEGDIDFDELKQLKIDPTESMLSIVAKGNLFRLRWLIGHIIDDIKSLSVYSIFPNTIRAPQAVSRGSTLESDGRNIASILKQLPTDRRRRIVKLLKVVLPQLEGITVKSAAGYYVPVLLVKGSASGDIHELNMSQVSDGTLRIFGMLTALFQTQTPSKIVIEEPEQMIHPALLMVIRDALLEYVNRREYAQAFITIALAASREGCSKIVIVVDLDDGCPVEELHEVSGRIVALQQSYGVEIDICFCLREFEVWYLRMIDHMTSLTKAGVDTSELIDKADAIRDAKGQLRKLLVEGYDVAADQDRLIRYLEPSVLYSRDRSFRKFVKCISGLDYSVLAIA